MVIFDIKRFAVHDGPGIRTTVFFKGCPLSCWWCHNPESQSPELQEVELEQKVHGKAFKRKKTYGQHMEEDELMEILLKDRVFYEESGGGITFSGGEPLSQVDALEAMLQRCKEQGLHTTVDTCGLAAKGHFERIAPLTDLFLYDLKNMDPALHKRYTGSSNELILENADFLLDVGSKVIFRIPVVPGINTSDEELGAFHAFLKDRSAKLEEVHLLPYHRIAGQKYARLGMPQRMSKAEEPEEAWMSRLLERFEGTGLKVDIGG